VTDAAGDEALVSRFLRRSDERAFDALYRRHTPRVFGLALRLVGGDEPEARDLVQDTWVRAIGGLKSFRWESRLSSWLCGICANSWRERVRRFHPEITIGELPQSTPPGPERALPEEPIDVKRALVRLAPGFRAVLVLYSVYGYSHAEIADLLRISEGTSKSQLHRARRALRAALAEPEEGAQP